MSSSGEEKGSEAHLRKPPLNEKPLTDGSEVRGSRDVESFVRLNLRNLTQFYEDELGPIE